MKKKFLIIVISIFQSILTMAQFSVKIVNENFNSNMMRWEIQKNENSEMAIQDGKYELACLKEGTAITTAIDVPHLQNTDYSITASMQKLKGIDDNGYGLLWGSQDANNEYEFIVSGNGQFKIIKWAQGNKTELIPWTYSMAIKKWDFSTNILKIQNLNHVFRFYINDNYVAAIKDLSSFGNRIGFVLNENMNVEVDYFIVENITSNNEIIDPEYSPNLKITKVEYQGNGISNELKYNESGSLNLQITNLGNLEVKDLIIKIEPKEPIYGLEFDPITMIDKLAPNEIKTFTIKLNANEEIPDQMNIFNIYLQNLNRERIDYENISIKTIGISTYYQSNSNNTPSTIDNSDTNTNIENKNTTSSTKMDGCTKGCSGIGLVTLITALILALL